MQTKYIGPVRQGDILLLKINSIPALAERLIFSTSIVLGEGETPGHRHECLEMDKVDAYKSAEGLYLDVKEETDLIHPEHDLIALDPGSYKVIHQTEYQRKELKRVQD